MNKPCSNYEKNNDECSNSKELEELAECDPDDSSMPPSMRSEIFCPMDQKDHEDDEDDVVDDDDEEEKKDYDGDDWDDYDDDVEEDHGTINTLVKDWW